MHACFMKSAIQFVALSFHLQKVQMSHQSDCYTSSGMLMSASVLMLFRMLLCSLSDLSRKKVTACIAGMLNTCIPNKYPHCFSKHASLPCSRSAHANLAQAVTQTGTDLHITFDLHAHCRILKERLNQYRGSADSEKLWHTDAGTLQTGSPQG